MKTFPLSKTFHLIEPGPVVLVTTAQKGRPNVMTMSWHMMMEFNPPRIGCIIGPWDYSLKALKATKECVIAIPTVDLAPKVVDIGNCSGEDVDKFETFGLTPVAAQAYDSRTTEKVRAGTPACARATRLLQNETTPGTITSPESRLQDQIPL